MLLLERSLRHRSLVLVILFISLSGTARPADLRLLFLGDRGPHQPVRRFEQLAPVLEQQGIELTYTEDLDRLNLDTLEEFDGLVLYANIDRIESAQAQALLEFVSKGKGFIPLHCASFCFRNSPEMVALIGAQFQSHGNGIVSTEITAPDHPIMAGFSGFTSWDESYVHTLHNTQNRTVLEFRKGEPQASGRDQEPWTWVRTHGEGRVFYTAWGHDERTWGHPGFQNLVARGIRWACGRDPALAGSYQDPDLFPVPAMTDTRTGIAPFEYVDVGAKIPNYVPKVNGKNQAQPKNLMQLPLPPDESLKHLVTPVGFLPRLFLSEEHLQGKPVTMNWDERGRLWVCETLDYPNDLQPQGQGHDCIRICTDTDGDGRADKFTVFADGLSIPTAIAFHRGGAIVQNGIETLYLKDTDGDDRADVRQVLITGWALGDTHGGVSNFRYGLDNWIWAMQGYNNSTPVINGIPQQSFRMGFFRFRLDNSDPPRVEELEFIRSTNNNTWGLGISEDGLIFASTANHNPSVYMPIANRYYERVQGWSPAQLGTIADTHLFQAVTENVRQVDHHGGYTAGAGHALYTARAYPQMWWNRTAFVCEPTGHLVGTFLLRRDGSDFHSTSPCNLLASDDEWTAPIMAEVGPDGQVWVLDWYNYIVQHNPTPQGFQTGKGNAYESDLRDKKHGRVYRVVHTASEASSAPVLSLDRSNVEQLLQALKNPTMRCRLDAQRLLVERGKQDVVPQLIALVQDQSLDTIGLNPGAMHALWTLHGLGALREPRGAAFAAVVNALRHPSGGVRRNALQVLPECDESTQLILSADLVHDPDAQVQLAALLALSEMPANREAGQALAELGFDRKILADRWLPDALTSAAATHSDGFLPALAKLSAQDSSGSELASQTRTLARTVAEHLARSRPSAQTVQTLLDSLSRGAPQLISVILDGISSGWPKDYSIALGLGSGDGMVALLHRTTAEGKARLVRLAPFWGSQALQEQIGEILFALLDVVKNEQVDLGERVSAARQLIEFQADRTESVTQLLQLVSLQTPPELAQGIIQTLELSTSPSLGTQLIAKAKAATPAVRAVMVRVLLSRPHTTRDLLTAIEAGEFQLTDLSLEQRQALNNHPSAELQARAKQLMSAGGGLPNPDRQRVVMEKLPLAELTGDVELGRVLFKKHCMKCHRHSGEGAKIGPDLTGMAVHPKKELLVHVLDPSRSVEGNFRSYTVVTVDGRILTGLLASESRTSIELVDSEAKPHAIRREDIEELVASKLSLMPEGFEKQLSDEDLTNLLEFLGNKGQYLPISLDKFATIVTTKGMFYSEEAEAERLIFDNWQPKTFAGIPFLLTDPQGDRTPNAIMLHGPQGHFPPRMPKQVTLPCHTAARAIHLLSGVSGWGATAPGERGISMIVRLRYADGAIEDHPMIDGQHFADYIRVIDVPQSQLAFKLRNQQLRYLSVLPHRPEIIETIELLKGSDRTAPIVMAVTIETQK